MGGVSTPASSISGEVWAISYSVYWRPIHPCKECCSPGLPLSQMLSSTGATITNQLPRECNSSVALYSMRATLLTFKPNDVIIIRMILHDWVDKDCVRILRAIRGAIRRSGAPDITLILSEPTPEVHDVIPAKYLIVLHTQVIFGAKERYRHEWDALFQRAGFTVATNIIRTRSLFSLVITKPTM